MTPFSLTCPALTGGAFPEIPTMSHTLTVTPPDHDYVLLDKMSDADIAFNVARLRHEGATKSKHADALSHATRTDKNKSTRKGSEAPDLFRRFRRRRDAGGISGIPPAIWYATDCRSSLS